MFFSGMEILNEHFLYQYNIKNDFKIQVMRVPRLKSDLEKEENKIGKKEVKKEENRNEKKSEDEV